MQMFHLSGIEMIRKVGFEMSNSQYRTLKKKLIIYVLALIIFSIASVYTSQLLLQLIPHCHLYERKPWSLILALTAVGFTVAQILTAVPILLIVSKQFFSIMISMYWKSLSALYMYRYTVYILLLKCVSLAAWWRQTGANALSHSEPWAGIEGLQRVATA